MKIIINIKDKDAKHCQSPHTFYDACQSECNIMYQVQKAIDKRLKKGSKRKK